MRKIRQVDFLRWVNGGSIFKNLACVTWVVDHFFSYLGGSMEVVGHVGRWSIFVTHFHLWYLLVHVPLHVTQILILKTNVTEFAFK